MNDAATDRAAMLATLLRERRSVRGYLSRPVSDDVLASVFSMAQCAPSGCNAQPWQVHVASGDAANGLREALHGAAATGCDLDVDFPLTGPYPAGVFRQRQIGAAVALFEATRVARDDRDARTQSMLRNFRFFEAPHVAFLFLPDWARDREIFDCGLYAQSLMLALTAYGIASCPQASLGYYADIIRQQLDIEGDMRLLLGISFGYADTTHPANRVRTERAHISEAVEIHTQPSNAIRQAR